MKSYLPVVTKALLISMAVPAFLVLVGEPVEGAPLKLVYTYKILSLAYIAFVAWLYGDREEKESSR